jgi:hypothetical protein
MNIRKASESQPAEADKFHRVETIVSHLYSDDYFSTKGRNSCRRTAICCAAESL